MKSFENILRVVLLGSAFILAVPLAVVADSTVAASASRPDYSVIEGDWQRTDGNYLVRVADIQADGRAKVEYFNPSPIHVAQAVISTRKELLELFIKFQDKGYEGSTYTLYYYLEKDALAGFYYQAALDRTYEVIFVRKTNQ